MIMETQAYHSNCEFGHLVDLFRLETGESSVTGPHIVYRPSAVCGSLALRHIQAGWWPEKMDVQIQSQEVGNWPQRLLHVPSMTSYEWRPGNMYGQFASPVYNAISYTWGRFRIQKKSRRHPQANVDIGGLPWDLPRISTQHYTGEALLRALRHAVSPDATNGCRDGLKFLWFDQACIEQRPGQARDLETGRQALFFYRAQSVFIWLTSKSRRRLEEIWEGLEEAAFACQQIQTTSVSWALIAARLLLDLVDDPWFTSLWTLQEAFCRPDAHILAQDGSIVEVTTKSPCSSEKSSATLQGLLDSCSTLTSACRLSLRRSVSGTSQRLSHIEKLLDWLNISGLSALATHHPINLYSAARFRTATRDWSYAYAIQQIFGFEPGTYINRASPGNSNFTAAELEVQMGAAMLLSYPVLSQLHVFTERHPIEGHAWHFNSSSRVPSIMHGGGCWSVPHITLCSLSTERSSGSWAQFSGKMCVLESLQQFWANENPRGRGEAQIFLDNCDFLPLSLSCQTWDNEGMQYQWKLWELLQTIIAAENLFVLLLGYYEGQEPVIKPETDTGGPWTSKGAIFACGLLLLNQTCNSVMWWRRLGFCVWRVADVEALTCTDGYSFWRYTSGLFG